MYVEGGRSLGSDLRGFRDEQDAAEPCCCLLGARSSQEGRIHIELIHCSLDRPDPPAYGQEKVNAVQNHF